MTADRVSRDLLATVTRLRRLAREAAPGHDLTPSEVSALGRIQRTPAVTASELARAERVRPQSMATTLRGLAGRGLITFEPDPSDGRRRLIRRTDAARALVEGARSERRDWLAERLDATYGEDELARIGAALELLERLT